MRYLEEEVVLGRAGAVEVITWLPSREKHCVGGSAATVSLGGETSWGRSASLPGVGELEHPSPGYGAGHDAGFLAKLLAASRGDATASSGPPPGSGPVAAEGAAGAGAPAPALPPMLALVEDFPDLFKRQVLQRVDPLHLALLGRTGSAVRTVVKLSGLPRVGGSAEEPRVGIAQFGRKSLSMFIVHLGRGEQLSVATCGHVRSARPRRAPGGAEAGAGAWLPVERSNVAHMPLGADT